MTNQLLQDRINELDSAIFNCVKNKVHLTGFSNETRLMTHLEKNMDNWRSKGIYDCHNVTFTNIKSNALFVVMENGEIKEKHKYTFYKSRIVERKSKPGPLILTIRKHEFNGEWQVQVEKQVHSFSSKEEMKAFLNNNYLHDFEIITTDTILENKTKECSGMDFITIDFETATPKNNSACSLGMVFVKDNKIIDEKYFLIHPPILQVDPENTKIHGLTVEDLKDAPKFDEIWKDISIYFSGNQYIAAHNAQFDLNVLKNCLMEYDLELPEFEYFCTIPFSTRACRGQGIGNSLKERTDYFGISLDDHHNALADAKACAELMLKCIAIKKRKSVHTYLSTFTSIPIRKFTDLKIQKEMIIRGQRWKNRVKPSDLVAASNEFDTSHPLYEKTIVFTGELESIDRKEVMQQVIDLGALVRGGVSGVTDYLVVGKQDLKVVGSDGLSSKERKANEFIAKGHPLEILNENELLVLLKS